MNELSPEEIEQLRTFVKRHKDMVRPTENGMHSRRAELELQESNPFYIQPKTPKQAGFSKEDQESLIAFSKVAQEELPPKLSVAVIKCMRDALMSQRELN